MPALLRSRRADTYHRATRQNTHKQLLEAYNDPENLLRKSRSQPRQVNPGKPSAALSAVGKPRGTSRRKLIKATESSIQAVRPKRSLPAARPKDQRRNQAQPTGPRDNRSLKTVSTWLDQVKSSVQRATSSSATPPSSSVGLDDLHDEMPEIEDETTYLTSATGKQTQLLLERLEQCNIEYEKRADPELSKLKALIADDVATPEGKPIQRITHAFRHFREKSSKEPKTGFAELVDGLCIEIDKARSELGLPATPSKYFRRMQEKCDKDGEAVLQRSMMMTIFHHYLLPELFDWNAEQLWQSPPADMDFETGYESSLNGIDNKDNREKKKSRGPSQPKPDLTISFKAIKFKESARKWPPSHGLRTCQSPEGTNRAFPFLIVDVKRGDASLQPAEIANLWTAGRALLNIYHWMNQAGLRDEFFQKVRVFSFAFNAWAVSVRVHRAKEVDGSLHFWYDTLQERRPYQWETIPRFIDRILRKYAAVELWETLRKTVHAICGRKVPHGEESSQDDDEEEAILPENDDGARTSRNGVRQQAHRGGSTQLHDEAYADDEDESEEVQPPETEDESEDNDSTPQPSHTSVGKRRTDATHEHQRKVQRGLSGKVTKEPAREATRSSKRLAGEKPNEPGGSFRVSTLSI